ncbi:MAG: 50S ribosomal protein L31 [Chloroflexi bacterium]|nr:50S ribosomal protein L31 [Chloroflexota bacterium]
MKPKIHPRYYPAATVTCASCGTTFKVGSTVQRISTDLCSNCHPFYTGVQRIVDTEGKVDRFYKKLEARNQYLTDLEARQTARISPELPIGELELGTRPTAVLERAGITSVGQLLEKMQLGDPAVLAIQGFGQKSLIDVKKRLRARGYTLPEEGELAEALAEA